MLMASRAASPRNVFGFIKGCFWKKSIKTGRSAFKSARDLSSSGESDFFLTTISGCFFRIFCAGAVFGSPVFSEYKQPDVIYNAGHD